MFLFKNSQVAAAGVTPISYHKGKYYALLMYRPDKKWYEDAGGKIEKQDKNIIETAARECGEETNNFIQVQSILNYRFSYFNTRCKYINFLVQTPMFDTNILGNRENLESIERYFEWVDCDKLDNIPKNYRLDKRWVFYLRKNLKKLNTNLQRN